MPLIQTLIKTNTCSTTNKMNTRAIKKSNRKHKNRKSTKHKAIKIIDDFVLIYDKICDINHNLLE